MTNALRQEFEQQGFVVVRDAIPDSMLTTIRSAAKKIVDEFDIDHHRSVFTTTDRDRGRDRYFMESSEAVHCFLEEKALDSEGNLTTPKSLAINKIGHALHDRIPAFEAFCRQPVFAELFQELGYRQPQLWQTMYIFKQPRIGGEVRWHQDASYLATDPSSVCGCWVAVEDASLDNGCLWVQPGGHRTPLRDIYEVDAATGHGVLRPLSDEPWPGPDEGQPLEVAAGTLVLFSDHLPHYSSPNYSDKSRQAFTLHVAEQDADWSEKNWLQRPNLAPFLI